MKEEIIEIIICIVVAICFVVWFDYALNGFRW